MTVAGHKVEVTFVEQVVLDAAHYHGSVALAHLGNYYADGETPLRAQGPGKKIRPIVQLASGGQNAVLRLLRNRIGNWRAIDNQRDRGRGKPQVLGQLL